MVPGLTNLNAGQISGGQLAATSLPTGGIWNANGMVLTNTTLFGNGAGLTGLTATQVSGLGGAATNSASAYIAGLLAGTNITVSLSTNIGGLVTATINGQASGGAAGVTGIAVGGGATNQGIVVLGSAALSDATAFATANHNHDTRYDLLGAASAVSNTFNASIESLEINKADVSTVWTKAEADNRYFSSSNTNLTATLQALLQNLPAQGDLDMGSFINQPGL